MNKPDIETMRQCLKAVISDYPGFLKPEVHASIDQLCDQAIKAVPNEQGLVMWDGIWLDGATEMYLDVQKVYPLTAPARTYAQQLLERIRKG
jgi:hypothetical protein